MTSYERFRCRLRGQPVDRAPNFDIMMVFAAHYVRQPLSAYYQDSRVLCEANLVVQEVFDLDIVQAISDPYRETADFGATIRFPHDGLPICEGPLLTDPEALSDLRPPDPWGGGRMTDRVQAVGTVDDQPLAIQPRPGDRVRLPRRLRRAHLDRRLAGALGPFTKGVFGHGHGCAIL